MAVPQTPPQGDPAPSGPGLHPLRVLLVDEEGASRHLLDALTALQCQTTAVASATEAVEEVRRGAYDLALCSLGGHASRGLELVSVLLGLAPSLEVVVLASDAGFGTAVEAMRRGAADYLAQPLKPSALRGLVDQARSRLPAGPRELAPPARGAPAPAPSLGGAFSLRDITREHVRRVVGWTGTLEEAARVLGVDRGTVRRKLREGRAPAAGPAGDPPPQNGPDAGAA